MVKDVVESVYTEPILPGCTLPPLLPAVNKGKGYSEPHLKNLLEVVLPALEVCKCARTTGGKQQLKTHVCLGFV